MHNIYNETTEPTGAMLNLYLDLFLLTVFCLNSIKPTNKKMLSVRVVPFLDFLEILLVQFLIREHIHRHSLRHHLDHSRHHRNLKGTSKGRAKYLKSYRNPLGRRLR